MTKRYFDIAVGVLRNFARWRWFGVVNSVAVLVLLTYALSGRLRDVDWRTILLNAQPGWFVGAVVGAIVVILAASLRTHDVFQREAGRKLAFASIARLQFITLFMSFAVPIAFAVDVVRIGMYRLRYDLSLAACTRAVIFDRALGAIGMVFGGILTYGLQPGLRQEPVYLVSFQIVMLAGVLGTIAFLIVLSRKGFAPRWWPLQIAVRWMSMLGKNFTSVDFVVRQSVFAIVYIASVALVLILLTRAFGFSIPPLLIIAFTPLIMFVSSLPFLYAGWGGRELIMVVTLSGVGGARADEALVLSIAFGVAMLVAALPGALFWIARPTFRKNEAPEPLTTRPNQA